MPCEILFNLTEQIRLTLSKRFIHDHERLHDRVALFHGEHLLEEVVRFTKYTASKMNAVAIAYLNRSLDKGHGLQCEMFDASPPILFTKDEQAEQTFISQPASASTSRHVQAR